MSSFRISFCHPNTESDFWCSAELAFLNLHPFSFRKVKDLTLQLILPLFTDLNPVFLAADPMQFLAPLHALFLGILENMVVI
jgi:hypothetical protein